MAHLTDIKGDTVDIDIIDRWGNMVLATPSGGWLHSGAVIPGLGFALNSRAQMFWLDEGLPSSLQPAARPRTTLTPTIADRDGRPTLSVGTRGDDQQDRWELLWFLRMAHHGFNLQQGTDAPMFHLLHFQGSLYPRSATPGRMMIEETIGADAVQNLRDRGRDVVLAPANTVGRLTAAMRHPDGQLQATTSPRLMQIYSIGR